MSRQLSSDRAHVKRITAAATVLALAGGAATVPLGPALPVAHAQVAPVPQEGLSHLSLIHISEPTRREWLSRMPSSA